MSPISGASTFLPETTNFLVIDSFFIPSSGDDESFKFPLQQKMKSSRSKKLSGIDAKNIRPAGVYSLLFRMSPLSAKSWSNTHQNILVIGVSL